MRPSAALVVLFLFSSFRLTSKESRESASMGSAALIRWTTLDRSTVGCGGERMQGRGQHATTGPGGGTVGVMDGVMSETSTPLLGVKGGGWRRRQQRSTGEPIKTPRATKGGE